MPDPTPAVFLSYASQDTGRYRVMSRQDPKTQSMKLIFITRHSETLRVFGSLRDIN